MQLCQAQYIKGAEKKTKWSGTGLRICGTNMWLDSWKRPLNMAGAEHWRMVWPYMHVQCMCMLNLFVHWLDIDSLTLFGWNCMFGHSPSAGRGKSGCLKDEAAITVPVCSQLLGRLENTCGTEAQQSVNSSRIQSQDHSQLSVSG